MEEKLLLNARKYQTSSSQVESSDIDDSPPQKRSRMDSQASGIFNFMTLNKNRTRPLSGEPAKHEVNQYLMEPGVDNNPLQFWESNENNYPILASMAKEISCSTCLVCTSGKTF